VTPAERDADLASTLAAVAQALSVESDLPATITRTCQLAVATIDACDHADVMVITAGGIVTVPGTTDWVATRVLSIEAEFHEGPCIDTYEIGQPVEASDLESEHRWPRFTSRCLAETPVRSCLGLPLVLAERTIGALDLYADTSDVFGPEDLAAGALFAAHAAVAFGAAMEREQLQAALASRDIIGQAKGILMAQSHVSADEAFDLLRRASQRLNEKLTALAQRIIDNAASP
jgi:GAF domain-containing protein